MTMPYDVGIIGGGIIGTSIAYLISKTFPDYTIGLFEQNLAGHGTTYYSAGLSAPLARTQKVKQLIENSEVIFEHDFPELLHQKTILYVIDKDKEDKFKNSFAGSDLEECPSTETQSIKQYFPDIQIPEAKKIFRSRMCHYTTPPALVEAMLTRLRKHTLFDIYEGTKITSIQNTEDNLIEIDSTVGQFLAKKVFVCTGPWTNISLSDTGELQNKRIIAFHLKSKVVDSNAPVIMFYDDDAFLLPLEARGHWLLSIASQVWGVNPEHSTSLNEDDYALAERVIKSYIPESFKNIQGGRVFCDSYTHTKEPRIENQKNVITCLGLSGSGYRLAEAVATQALKYL